VSSPTSAANHLHLVTLKCKNRNDAERCLHALAEYGKPDALAFGCQSYEFGLQEGTADTVYLVERWTSWRDLDALLQEKVVPALPLYNELLEQPFEPARDTLRIRLSGR